MSRFPMATEPVIRHRGGGRNENGKLVAESPPATLTAIAVAPGGGSERLERAHDGESIVCTVYFPPGTDIVNSDELTVRGERFCIIVNDWRPSDDAAPGGLEVLCTRGEG